MTKNPQIKKNRKRARRQAIRIAVLVNTLVFILAGTITLSVINGKILYTQWRIYSYNRAIDNENSVHDYNYDMFKLYGAQGYLSAAEVADEKADTLKEERQAFLSKASNDSIMSWASQDEGDAGTVMIAFSGFLFIVAILFLTYPGCTPDRCGLSEKEYLTFLIKEDLRLARYMKDRWEIIRVLAQIVICWRNSLNLFEKLILLQEWIILRIFRLYDMIVDHSIVNRFKTHCMNVVRIIRNRRSKKNKSCYCYIETAIVSSPKSKKNIVPFGKKRADA